MGASRHSRCSPSRLWPSLRTSHRGRRRSYRRPPSERLSIHPLGLGWKVGEANPAAVCAERRTAARTWSRESRCCCKARLAVQFRSLLVRRRRTPHGLARKLYAVNEVIACVRPDSVDAISHAAETGGVMNVREASWQRKLRDRQSPCVLHSGQMGCAGGPKAARAPMSC